MANVVLGHNDLPCGWNRRRILVHQPREAASESRNILVGVFEILAGGVENTVPIGDSVQLQFSMSSAFL